MSTWRTGMTFDTFDTCEETSEERMASLMSSPSAVMLGCWVDADVEVVAGEEFGDCFGDLLLIHLIAVEVDALMQAPPGACAVHGAGIEVGEAEMAGQRLRSGGLSGRPQPSMATRITARPPSAGTDLDLGQHTIGAGLEVTELDFT